MHIDYGYQLERLSADTLWLEILAPGFSSSGRSSSTFTGSTDLSAQIYTAGGRFMIPLEPRLSIYGSAGVGIGIFHYPVIAAEPDTGVFTNEATHGVFEFGGGIDFRLWRPISLRIELRDFVSGRNLSGIRDRTVFSPPRV